MKDALWMTFVLQRAFFTNEVRAQIEITFVIPNIIAEVSILLVTYVPRNENTAAKMTIPGVRPLIRFDCVLITLLKTHGKVCRWRRVTGRFHTMPRGSIQK